MKLMFWKKEDAPIDELTEKDEADIDKIMSDIECNTMNIDIQKAQACIDALSSVYLDSSDMPLSDPAYKPILTGEKREHIEYKLRQIISRF